jgi:hypothetical protein
MTISESNVKELYTQFNKAELVQVAEELDLDIDPQRMSNRQISKKILGDLDDNGVPEADDCSELLNELLYAAEYIDEQGELLEEVDTETEEIEEEPEVVEEQELPEELPVCFSFADERDPACNRCKVKPACLEARIINRPPCFGKHYDENAVECQGCMEAINCKPLSLKEN